MPKIVVAIDSLKGCLTSPEAGEAVAAGVKRACPRCEVAVVPVADGGEGMLEALSSGGGGRLVRLSAHGPLMEERAACYGLSADGATAFVEMARISGLPLVPEERRNPMLTTTFGTGELLRDAYRVGYRPEFTDDASVVEASGCPIHLCEGERANLKITTREDLVVAAALLEMRDEEEQRQRAEQEGTAPEDAAEAADGAGER